MARWLPALAAVVACMHERVAAWCCLMNGRRLFTGRMSVSGPVPIRQTAACSVRIKARQRSGSFSRAYSFVRTQAVRHTNASRDTAHI